VYPKSLAEYRDLKADGVMLSFSDSYAWMKVAAENGHTSARTRLAEFPANVSKAEIELGKKKHRTLLSEIAKRNGNWVKR
jgi:hypothetical protein